MTTSSTLIHCSYLASLALTFLTPPPIALAGNGACRRERLATAVEPTILLKKERRDEDSSSIIDDSMVVVVVDCLAIGANAPTDAQHNVN